MLQIVSLDSYFAGGVLLVVPQTFTDTHPIPYDPREMSRGRDPKRVWFPMGQETMEYVWSMEYGALAWGLTLQFF